MNATLCAGCHKPFVPCTCIEEPHCGECGLVVEAKKPTFTQKDIEKQADAVRSAAHEMAKFAMHQFPEDGLISCEVILTQLNLVLQKEANTLNVMMTVYQAETALRFKHPESEDRPDPTRPFCSECNNPMQDPGCPNCGGQATDCPVCLGSTSCTKCGFDLTSQS